MTTPDKPKKDLSTDLSRATETDNTAPQQNLESSSSPTPETEQGAGLPAAPDETSAASADSVDSVSSASYEGALSEGKLSRREKKALKKQQGKQEARVQGSLAASTWVGLVIGLLLLILLIVFIMQNQQQVPMNFLKWSGEFPAGIAYLIFAVAGALLMALVGGLRMLELHRQVRRQTKRKRR